MTLASTWFDLVIGVDLHQELVPGVPAPVPFPHPFVGLVGDPLGSQVAELLGPASMVEPPPSRGGVVLIGGQAASITGDAATMPAGHGLVPPGVAWAPMPTAAGAHEPSAPAVALGPPGDARLAFGSASVHVQGRKAVRALDPALSCSDPVRMPTALVLSSGSTHGVIVGGPPRIDEARAEPSGLPPVPARRWTTALPRGSAERFVPKRADRARDFLPDAACFVTGHPVNVVNGGMFTTWTDFELPGPIPLTFSRRYRSSFCGRDSVLGHGWSHGLDQQIWVEEGRVVHLSGDGRELEFDTWDLPQRVMGQGDAVFSPIDRLTLTATGPGTWEISGPDGLIRQFARVPGESPRDAIRGLARLIRIRDRSGHAIELHYDDAARLDVVVDSGGRRLAFAHDREGRLVKVSLPRPEGDGLRPHVEFGYSDQGDLCEVTDARGHAVHLEYDHHLLVRETDRNGLSFFFQYDGWGPTARCTRTWGDGGLLDHLITYDLDHGRTVVEDSQGAPTVYTWGPYGLVTSKTDASGGTTRFEYDDRLQRTAVIDPLGGVTRTEYDERGNVTRTTGPDGAVTESSYDDHDALVRRTTPRGGVWRWTYDDRGRRRTQTDPEGARTRYVYDDARLVAIEDPAGARTTLRHDRAGNLVQLVHPDGSSERWRYDALGRILTVTDARGNEVRITRDALGQPIRIDEPDGNVVQLEHDAEGNVVRIRDHARDARFTYRGLGRLASRSIAGTTVSLHYDAEERLVGFTNEKGIAMRLERDGAGRVSAEIGFDGARRTMVRDAAGRITRLLRPGEGKSTSFAYDAVGRVTAVTHSDGTEQSYAYDEDGALIAASSGDLTLRLARDLTGRVVVEDQGERRVSSRFDSRGLRTRVSSTLGAAISIERDRRGRATDVSATRGSCRWRARISRDPSGLECDRALPGGARSYWWRDGLGRPTQHWVGREAQVARGRRYRWGSGPRIEQLHEHGREALRYEYDQRGRLVAVQGAGDAAHHRQLDEVGNPHRTPDGTDRRYGPGGALEVEQAAEGARHFEYDAEGNLVGRVDPDGGRWSYRWNGAGQLIRVIRPDRSEVTFAYDPLGRRIRKTVGDRTTTWVWDGEVVLHELTHATEATAERAEVTTWVFEPERFAPMARVGADEAHSIVCDHLGVPLCALDDEGEARWSGRLDAWGAMQHTGSSSLCPWRFPGQYEDAQTGLYYNRFRYYDPSQGIYISEDPIRMRGGPALRTYVDDPLSAIDPLGLSSRSDYTRAGARPRTPALGPTIEPRLCALGPTPPSTMPIGLQGPERSTRPWYPERDEIEALRGERALLEALASGMDGDR